MNIVNAVLGIVVGYLIKESIDNGGVMSKAKPVIKEKAEKATKEVKKQLKKLEK